MKIGLASYKFINNNLNFNISQIEKALSQASDINLLCFGESFLQGFDALTWDYEKDKKIALEQNSETINKLVDLSKNYHTDLAFGYIEKDNEDLYSSYMIIINGQKAHNYRRISKGWKEESKTDFHYKEGNEIVSFNYMSHYITIALCGDLWEYPDKFKCNDLLLWPVYINFTLTEWSKYEQEYAEQAGLICKHTLMVNSISNEPIAHGNAFYFFNGQIIKTLSYDEEGILIIDDEKDIVSEHS